MYVGQYEFPKPSDTNVLMMPYVQGDPDSLPDGLEAYHDFVSGFAFKVGKRGYLTINESFVDAGDSQRGYGNGERTLHTEGCKYNRWTAWNAPVKLGWGDTTGWGRSGVLLDSDLQVMVGNSITGTCAVWDAEEQPTTDGDLGRLADKYPRSEARILKAGEIVEFGIRTPHECIPQKESGIRQFVRIVGDGVHGRAPNWTVNGRLGV